MRLSSLNRRKQLLLSGTLALALALATIGLLALPDEAVACIPCEGTTTQCGSCQQFPGAPPGVGKKHCTVYQLSGCHPNPGCSQTPISSYSTWCSL